MFAPSRVQSIRISASCIATALAMIIAGNAAAQETLNYYYAFPLSIGAGYTPLSPIGGVDRTAKVNEIVGALRIPIPGVPMIQPFLTGGMRVFDADEADAPTVIGGALDDGVSMPDYDARAVWDHTQIFGALGASYAHRVSKEFEIGVDASVGFGESIFSRRLVTAAGEWSPIGALGLTFGLEGKIALNPSYNFSVDVKPVFRYELGLGAMHDFDGFYFGIGFGASYRFGTDPDAPVADIRAIRFGELQMPPVFAAMQSVYVKEPISTIELSNIESDVVEDVKVLFNQPGFMDSPTASAQAESILPGETIEVPIHGSFNREVFSTNGVTPLNGEIIVRYTYKGRPVEQRESVTYDLHDRNALTWDDDRKVAAFMTYSDSAIRNYSSFIRSAARNDNTDYFPDSLEFAMQAYHSLASLGILYQPDPSSPFTQVQENTVIVDSVNLPRETLRSITGDCDDLTVLYNTMLETVGISTGFVTIPGHIYTAIDTEVAPNDYAEVHPDPEMTMEIDGSLWILVEITLVGQSNYLDAWRTGMRQWRDYDGNESMRSFNSTAASQLVFRPVGLTETDLGLQYGDPEAFLQTYRADIDRLSAGILAPLRDRAESRGQPRSWNHLGVTAGRLGQFATAQEAFERAAALDRSYVNPLINQGSLQFLQGNYDEAIVAYEEAERLLSSLPQQSGSPVAVSVYLNLSRALYAVNRYEEAAEFVARAESIDSGRAAEYGYIAAEGSDGSRASSRTAAPILFVDDEEQ